MREMDGTALLIGALVGALVGTIVGGVSFASIPRVHLVELQHYVPADFRDVGQLREWIGLTVGAGTAIFTLANVWFLRQQVLDNSITIASAVRKYSSDEYLSLHRVIEPHSDALRFARFHSLSLSSRPIDEHPWLLGDADRILEAFRRLWETEQAILNEGDLLGFTPAVNANRPQLEAVIRDLERISAIWKRGPIGKIGPRTPEQQERYNRFHLVLLPRSEAQARLVLEQSRNLQERMVERSGVLLIHLERLTSLGPGER